MSLTYGFYNSLNGDRKYDAIQFGQIFDGIIKDGVFMSIGGKLMVTASSGMKVSVATGRAWFDSTWTYNDATMLLDIPASEVLLNRIDAVVLEVNATDTSRTNSLKVVKGTPATNPMPPAMVNGGKIYQHPLAHVYVAAGATSISQSNITNKVGTSDCPFVTGILETMNIDALISQWGTEWDEFMSETETMTNHLITNWTNEWDTWFADVKNTLSGDVAGNLQNQINAVNSNLQNQINAVDSNLQNQINTCAKTVTYNASVGTSWTTGNGYVQQTVPINGLLATDNPIIDLTTSTSNFEIEQENWGKIFKVTTAENEITLYASEATAIVLSIQLKVIR